MLSERLWVFLIKNHLNGKECSFQNQKVKLFVIICKLFVLKYNSLDGNILELLDIHHFD